MRTGWRSKNSSGEEEEEDGAELNIPSDAQVSQSVVQRHKSLPLVIVEAAALPLPLTTLQIETE